MDCNQSDRQRGLLRKEFGRRLRRHRLTAGMTHAGLAHLVNLDETDIARLELGQDSPQLDTLEQLAHALNTPPALFFPHPETEPQNTEESAALRYLDLFEGSPISLWEEDLSDLLAFLASLRAKGVQDFRSHFRDHPEELDQCARLVRILDVNQATLDLLEAKSKADLYDGLPKVLTPESSEVFLEEMATLAEGGRSFSGEITHRTLTGKLLHLSIHFRLMADPFKEARVVVSLMDITDRKRMEEALLHSQARLCKAQEVAGFGCFDWDLRSGQVFWSDQTYRIYGLQPGTIQPNPNLMYGLPESEGHNTAQDLLAQKLGEKGDFEEERTIPLPSGDSREILIKGACALDAQGQPEQAIGVIQDITDRKKLEQMRNDVERILRHDLQSPLAAAATAARAFKDDKNLSQPQRFVLNEIERTTSRVLTMVRRHQDMFRIEIGNYKLRPHLVDLVPLGMDVYRELSDLFARDKINFQFRVNGEPALDDAVFLVNGDAFLLQTMLSNLIRNAAEASPPSGKVILDMTDGDDVVIRISNKGAVPEEIHDRFFEKYATAGKSYGTGLGTYSARLIARTLGGETFMETSETQGTTVTVRLPAPPEFI
ncbi:MAG: ATP-binding protein [Desulfovibrionaceae bacterium]